VRKAEWDWLGRWESPNGGVTNETVYVPAVNAAGYQYYPRAVEVAAVKEKADFTRGPQLRWWQDDKKDAPAGRGKQLAGARR